MIFFVEDKVKKPCCSNLQQGFQRSIGKKGHIEVPYNDVRREYVFSGFIFERYYH